MYLYIDVYMYIIYTAKGEKMAQKTYMLSHNARRTSAENMVMLQASGYYQCPPLYTNVIKCHSILCLRLSNIDSSKKLIDYSTFFERF